jgi:hypothetical protein
MKVFISWSKSLSQECAEILRNWIKCTLQASKPWMSSEDLDKGTVWFNQISSELSDTSIGIICLTKENKNNPWILFESGALAKGLEEQRVYTLLIDLKPKDIEPPLSQFNHTTPSKMDMKKLLVSINKQLGEQALEDKVLEQVFDMYWPQFDKDFKSAIKNHPEGEVEEQEARSSDDLLSEILSITRNLDRRIRNVEDKPNTFPQKSKRMPQQSSSISIGEGDAVELEAEIYNFIQQGYSATTVANLLEGKAPRSHLMSAAVRIEKNLKGVVRKKPDEFKL